jgi:hypothetical protein
MAAFMQNQGGSAIQEAMGRRGLSGGVTNQVSTGAPTAPDAVLPTQMPPSAPGTSSQPGTGVVEQAGQGESKIILNAMKSRLELLGKMGM